MQQQKIPVWGEDVWKPHIANLAPLSDAFVAHIFAYPKAVNLPSYGRQEPPRFFDQVWHQIQQARRMVSHFLVPVVAAETRTAQDRLTPDWFMRNFAIYSGSDTRLPRTTVQEWINKHLLRSTKHSRLEPNSVAALYMMRYLFEPGQRRWMPKWQNPDAPWFYVWGIRPDETIPRMYPYPLREQSNMLYWTQFLGPSWLPGWIAVPGIGSLAWGKTIGHGGQWYWNLTEEEMSLWDNSLIRATNVKHRLELLSPVFERHQGFNDAREHYRITRLHQLANMLLVHIGEPILAGHMQHYFGGDRPPDRPYIPF